MSTTEICIYIWLGVMTVITIAILRDIIHRKKHIKEG
jgi:hypothetical protein